MQTQVSAPNKVAKTPSSYYLQKWKKIKWCVVFSWPLVKITGLWWIKSIYSTTAFPSQTLTISSAINNQHPEKYHHLIMKPRAVPGWCHELVNHSTHTVPVRRPRCALRLPRPRPWPRSARPAPSRWPTRNTRGCHTHRARDTVLWAPKAHHR